MSESTLERQARRSKSFTRTFERYETKLALAEAWEAAGTDPAYAAQLRKEATKLRAQLKVKGMIFEDDGDGL